MESVIRRPLARLWYSYKLLVGEITCRDGVPSEEGIVYWREQLFTTFITYLLPACLVALVPGVWMSIKSGLWFIAVFDLLAAAGIALVTFHCRFSLNFRRAFVMGILYSLAIILLLSLGLFGPGLIYLFALSVFVTLILPRPFAYWSVALNLLICVSCALIIEWQLFDSPLIRSYSLGSWIAVSSNLIFLSWISVMLISKTISSLERVTANGLVRNQQLKESEGYYKKLFSQGPSPMWILDSENLQFLQVNELAIHDYGYTNEEFMSMTIMDIKLPKDLQLLHKDLQKSLDIGTPLSTVTRHRRKNNDQFPVEVKFNSILFKGKRASLVIARDISESVDHIQAIESQNHQLMEIAFIQSHHVRAPLARIMGLVNMIAGGENKESVPELLVFLDRSANDLDQVIREITANTQQLKVIRTAG